MNPGDMIMSFHCPRCGARLDLMHGEDDGDLTIIGTPTLSSAVPYELIEIRRRVAAALFWLDQARTCLLAGDHAMTEQAENQCLRHIDDAKDALVTREVPK